MHEKLQKCNTAKLQPIKYHPLKTQFLHPSLALKCFNPTKGHGIIATEKIKFGTVLAVDYPLISVPDKQMYLDYFQKNQLLLVN